MKNRKIVIEIPDDLNKEQEAIAIAKALTKKAISSAGQKVIGNSITVKHLVDTIIVKRISKEKPETLEVCYCGSQYAISTGTFYYTNYGGVERKVKVCSIECRDYVLSQFGDRVAVSKSLLKPLHFLR